MGWSEAEVSLSGIVTVMTVSVVESGTWPNGLIYSSLCDRVLLLSAMCCLENRLREVNLLAQVTQLMSAAAKAESEAVMVLLAAPRVASSCCRPFRRMATPGREGTQALPAAPAWRGRQTGTHGRPWALPLMEPLGLAAPWTCSEPPSYIRPSPWAVLGQLCSLDSDGKGLTPLWGPVKGGARGGL